MSVEHFTYDELLTERSRLQAEVDRLRAELERLRDLVDRLTPRLVGVVGWL